MEKKLLPEEIVQIRMDLTNKASAVRRRAAKNIRKHNLVELGEELYLVYLHERKDKRTWETQMEMINALGKIRYTAVLPYLEEIIEKNKRLDAITSSAALAYIRIIRQSSNDIKPVLHLLEHGNLSVINGATEGLAYDKMIPSKEEQELLINLFDNMPLDRLHERGCFEPREKFLSALSQWDKNVTKGYITKYLNDSDRDLRMYAEAALKGKCLKKE